MPAPEIDRLIEEGLARYGQGDLDGALETWEKALEIDPDNPQAMSYAEYVRTNYDLLTADLGGEATIQGAPFGIADDEPEYQIEIQPGEIKAAAPDRHAPPHLDPADEGWYIDEETQSRLGPPGIAVDQRPSQDLTMELEADEPPERPSAAPPVRAPSSPGLDFDTATREYERRSTQRAIAESDEFGPDGGTPAFGHPNDFQTPPGFGTQTTGIKRRELGFVTPIPATGEIVANAEPSPPPTKLPMTSTDLGLPERPRPPAKSSSPPIDLPPARPTKTMQPMQDAPAALELEADMPEISLEPADVPTLERKPVREEDLEEMDLISSLPAPRARPEVKQIEIDTPLSGSSQQAKPTTPPPTKPTTPPPTKSTTPPPTQPRATQPLPTEQSAAQPKVTTRDLPLETRAPAFSQAKTKELPQDAAPSVGKAQTQDFDAKTTEHPKTLPSYQETQDVPVMPLMGTPTQDLGLRDVHRAETANATREATARDAATRADVVLPFDPIDARSAEILDEIDRNAPARESPEDKTRRRLTSLFERATEWSLAGDLERSVAAIDLALSEDPNSALGQKLIHRNRETIMSVFQSYLGNLDRAPQLARPLHELANAPISPRAAFLLSRIDGLLTIDEILDVCGMPRLEAYRYLCQLFLRGILR